MDDKKIIELFFARSEKAVNELSDKYGSVCMKAAMNILADKRDAEECVNDSYLSVWETVPPQKPESLLAYVCKIVRNLSLKRIKHNSAKKRSGNYGSCFEELAECLPSAETVEDEIQASELSGIIDEFIDTLDYTNRLLFVRRYWFMDSYEDLSNITGIKEGAVRTRLSRIRGRLRDYLEKRGILP